MAGSMAEDGRNSPGAGSSASETAHGVKEVPMFSRVLAAVLPAALIIAPATAQRLTELRRLRR